MEKKLDLINAKEILELSKQRYLVMETLLGLIKPLIETKVYEIVTMEFVEGMKEEIGLLIDYYDLTGKEYFVILYKNYKDDKFSFSTNSTKLFIKNILDDDSRNIISEVMDKGIEYNYQIESKTYNLSQNYLLNLNNSFLGVYTTKDNNLNVKYDYEKEEFSIYSPSKRKYKDEELLWFLEQIKVPEQNVEKQFQLEKKFAKR